MSRWKVKNGGPKGRAFSHAGQISAEALAEKRRKEAEAAAEALYPQKPAVPCRNGISPAMIRAARKKKS